MKVIAFAASNSSQSINKKLVHYAAGLVPQGDVSVLDLNDYELPLFSEGREKELGQPERAQAFVAQIALCDGLIISYAEHNGSYTAAWKNLFDWCSRIEKKVFHSKPALFLSTSPGPGGASTVLASALQSAPFFAANVKASLSIPSFYKNFDVESNTVSNSELNDQLKAAVVSFSDN